MWRRIAVAWLITNLVFPNIVLADTLSITPWSSGDALNQTNLNLRSTEIQTVINGNITNVNISGTAAITGGKLDLTSGTGRITNSAGTITSDLNALNSSATWNSVSTTFTGWKLNVSITAAAAASRLMALQADSNDVLWVGRSGQMYLIPASLSGTSLGTASGAWLTVASGSFVDTGTAGSGTSTSWVAHMFGTPTLKAKNTSVTTASAATVYISAGPLAGSNMTLTKSWPLWIGSGAIRADGGVEFSDGTSITSALQNLGGSIWGATLSNNAGDATNDIDIAAGEAVSDDALIANRRLMTISALTKRTDAAWAVGTNQGCWDTGSVANGMVHVFAIFRTDTSVADALCSASATSPTMPTNYTKKRRIGSIPRALGAMVGFIQDGDRFDLKIPTSALETTNPGTSAVTAQLAVASGASVQAVIGWRLTGGATGSNMLVTALDTTDTVPSDTLVNARVSATAQTAGEVFVRTNTSGQVRYRVDFSDGSTVVRLVNLGWLDARGRQN